MSRPAIILPPGIRLTTDATEPAPPVKRPEVIRVRWRRPARVLARVVAVPALAAAMVAAARLEALIVLFVDDLRAKADATDDPGCVIWLALHASAGITGDLGKFDRRGVRSS